MTSRLLRRGAGVLIPLLSAACQRGPRVGADEALLMRQLEGAQTLLARARKGPLVDFDKILVVVHEHLVQDLLQAATPFEGTVGDGLRIRVESATVRFADGFALVRLDGRASLEGRDDYADVSVYAGLEVHGLDPRSGVLRAGLRVFSVEAPKVNVLGVDRSARDIVAALGRSRLEDYGRILSSLEIPVRIETKVAIPATDNERIHIPEADVPIEASLLEVRVFSGRLWIALGAQVGERQSPAPKTANR